MGKNKPFIGLIVGLVVAIILWFTPLSGLSPAGQKCLALTFMTVIFWGFQIAQPGYVSGVYLVALIIFGVLKPADVFAPWLTPNLYLIMGAYLIAAAVKGSGLGERIAYNFILKFVTSYKSVIISIFVITFILSFLIPHPWPRAFLIMSVMAVVIKSGNVPKVDAVKIGFTVFAASVPISMILLTGDSTINILAAEATGMNVSWIDWFIYMGPPNIVASILACILILYLFPPTAELSVNKDEMRSKLAELGSMKPMEKKTAVWVALAIVLWATDSLHGVNIGWVTLGIAMLMGFPKIGVIGPADWGTIPVHVLIFLTAAMTIGKAGGITGMNPWIAKTLLPTLTAGNIFVIAGFITAASVVIHMLLGSVIAVMGIAIPALLLFTQPLGVSQAVVAFMVYIAVATHFVFPFQHLNMLVGQGEANGMYGQNECIKYGIPLTIIVFIVCVGVCVPYWMMIGLLK